MLAADLKSQLGILSGYFVCSCALARLYQRRIPFIRNLLATVILKEEHALKCYS